MDTDTQLGVPIHYVLHKYWYDWYSIYCMCMYCSTLTVHNIHTGVYMYCCVYTYNYVLIGD